MMNSNQIRAKVGQLGPGGYRVYIVPEPRDWHEVGNEVSKLFPGTKVNDQAPHTMAFSVSSQEQLFKLADVRGINDVRAISSGNHFEVTRMDGFLHGTKPLPDAFPT